MNILTTYNFLILLLVFAIKNNAGYRWISEKVYNTKADHDYMSNTLIKTIENLLNRKSILVLGGCELTAWVNQVDNSKSFITSDFIAV